MKPQTAHQSVLTERPGGHREMTPETSTLLWAALAIGVVAVVGVAFANWLTTKVRSGERKSD